MIKNNIIRVQKNKDNPYLVLNKTCSQDENLSWAAKGLHTYLMTLPDDWTIYVTELIKHTSSGRDHTYTVLKELMKFGYIQRFQYRHKGTIIASNYVVYETPIDTSDFDNTKATIVKVDENGEIIETSTCKPNPETTDSVMATTVDTTLLINNNTNYLNKLNNDNDVVVDTHEQQIIDLYKTFKIEKRVMPHTLKLLKKYSEFISLDVFEHIFIQASENSVAKKYNYIKTMLETFFDNKVFTMNDLTQYNQKFKESKSKPTEKKATYTKAKKNNFDNFNATYCDQDVSDLDDEIELMQQNKYKR